MSKMNITQNGNVIFEDAKIIFRNFEGKEKEFNSAGDRNFCLVLDPQQAAQLEELGWNIKKMKPRDEGDEPDSYVEVKVEYRKGRPPRCVLVNSKGRQDLGAEEIGMFDWVDIKKVDLIINPYPWNVSGKSGVKAYLKSIFLTINEDELELMYAAMPENSEKINTEDPQYDLYNE